MPAVQLSSKNVTLWLLSSLIDPVLPAIHLYLSLIDVAGDQMLPIVNLTTL